VVKTKAKGEEAMIKRKGRSAIIGSKRKLALQSPTYFADFCGFLRRIFSRPLSAFQLPPSSCLSFFGVQNLESKFIPNFHNGKPLPNQPHNVRKLERIFIQRSWTLTAH